MRAALPLTCQLWGVSFLGGGHSDSSGRVEGKAGLALEDPDSGRATSVALGLGSGPEETV